MDLSAEISYPGATCDEAFALVVDPKFRSAVCEATTAVQYDVGIDEADDGGASVRVDRTLPAQVPDFVKKLVGENLDTRQTENWAAAGAEGRRTADILIEVLGQPAKMTGTVVLEPTTDGCREVISGQVKVSIPFLGGKIEHEVAKAIVAGIKVEQKTGREWLAKG